ncbi:MAG: hypothetical protein ACE5HL_02360 [Terriglobia bacterium]
MRIALLATVGLSALLAAPPQKLPTPPPTALALPQETHLRNVRQLTFGGENAEAYFSPDNQWLILQAAGAGVPCDQIFIMPAKPSLASDGADSEKRSSDRPSGRMVSTGQGKTTCAYFFPRSDRILYSSTHLANPECPPRPDYSRGYVWPVYSGYDIFTARRDGSDLRRLTHTPGYDAEAVVSLDGKKIIFTSARDGDLEIYVMDADGTNVRRLTHEVGYDGGAFFSPDGTTIVYRAHHPTDPEAIADYQALLKAGLVRPTQLEIWVMDADGSHKRQVTANGAANFAPFFHPDGQRIIFASNMADPRGRNFDLYLINLDATALERVTFHPAFDGFPMFSSDGRQLVWASNRHHHRRGETNIFIAAWVE